MFKFLFTAVGRRVELIQAFRKSYHKHRIPAEVIGVDVHPKMASAGYFTDAIFEIPRDTEKRVYRKVTRDLL